MIGLGRTSGGATTPGQARAASQARRYDVARLAMVSWALRPLGLGRTHSSAPPSRSSWRPWAAFGLANACRYAVRPSTATTLGSQRRTVCLERHGAGAQLVEAQLLGTGARRRNDVGDADPEPEHQFAIGFAHAIADINQVRGDAGRVQRRPEAVAATGEMSVDRGGPQPGVDPNEQESDAIVDEVVHGFAMERSKLRTTELHRAGQAVTRLRDVDGSAGAAVAGRAGGGAGGGRNGAIDRRSAERWILPPLLCRSPGVRHPTLSRVGSAPAPTASSSRRISRSVLRARFRPVNATPTPATIAAGIARSTTGVAAAAATGRSGHPTNGNDGATAAGESSIDRSVDRDPDHRRTASRIARRPH